MGEELRLPDQLNQPRCGTHVLVVEDDPDAGRALVAILELEKFRVTWARTVAEALGALDPGLKFILLDLMLPDGQGREVAEQARSRGMSAKVVIVTGGSESIIEQVLDLKPQLVLHKPVDPPALLRWLGHLSA